MLDLHHHSLLSDGALIPAELVRRVDVMDYRFIAITDHIGPSNLIPVAEAVIRAAEQLNPHLSVTVIPGVELTHVPPGLIKPLADQARSLGIKWVVVHGETPVEPVAPGTNQAALEAKVDLLAHPGLIDESQVALARENNVFLELSSKKGHCLTNGRTAALALRAGTGLLVNSDGHEPGDILTDRLSRTIALGSGLTEAQADELRRRALEAADRAASR